MPRAGTILRGSSSLALALCFLGAPVRAEDPVGMIYVRSEPAGASVFLDEGTSALGKTPCLLRDIAPGRHVVRGKLDGGQELRAEVVVQAGSLVKVELKSPAGGAGEGPARAPEGELQVSSDPPGATVWLDGVERGKTPLSLVGIPVGEHRVRIARDGYDDVERRLTTRAGSNSLEVTLTAADSLAAPAAPAPTPQEPGDRPAAPLARKESVPRTIEVDCPACKGSGLCKEIGCIKCGADGHIGWSECASCGGSGRAVYMCPVCQGQGRVVSGGKEFDCRACAGKGAPPCLLCKGKGKIPKPNPEAAGGPTKPCIVCDGTGFEQREKCLVCSGRGEMTSSESLGLLRRYIVFKCPFCGGDGLGPPICQQCRGRGYQGPDKAPYPCPGCAGTGHMFLPCKACGGRGFVLDKSGR